MIIKKYKAKTEQEAIEMAKDELGPDAIVMNVKTIKGGGLFGLFKKSRVELTAAVDDTVSEEKKDDKENSEENSYHFGRAFADSKDYSEAGNNAIEEKINTIAKLLEQQIKPEEEVVSEEKKEEIKEIKEDIKPYSVKEAEAVSTSRGKVIDLIYNKLIENEVRPMHADMIVEELDENATNHVLDNVLSNAYQKIVLKLGEIKPLKAGEKKPTIVYFVGNTGVGKTTTMAKLASKCILEEKLSVAMLSVDTYRIAAIEQIKTYANILNAPMDVIYTPEDMRKAVEKYKNADVILVDTAGRSHKNEEQRDDLKAIIDSVPDCDKEVYLVVSATTKYNDLLDISVTYSKLFDYKIIFTKLDETSSVGCILNLKLDTDKDLSYVTWGQNVPEDIGAVNPQVIAKQLLGGAK